MVNEVLSQIGPSEGFSVVRQAMEDAIAFFLPIGGPALARQHVESLASSMSFYPDCRDAYRDAMAKISQIEKAEQQRQEERRQQQQQELIIQLIGATKSQKNYTAVREPHSDLQVGEPAPLCNSGLPAKLSTDKAMLMWQRLQQAGLVDDHYQPVNLSRTLSAVLADEMLMQLADENEKLLGIDDKWRPYEILWGRKNMKADHYRSLNQNKACKFRDKIHKLLTAIS